jgi:asparagine N-glycosylation enzyme membrane subunit Stt3
MDKRGQFYIVAAMIIVIAVSSIASLTTYAAVKPEPRTLEDMNSELNEEGLRVVEYGIVNSVSNLNSLLEEFTTNKYAPYFLQKTNNANIVFLYGNKNRQINAVQYKTKSTGQISANIGSGSSAWNEVNSFSEKVDISVTGNKVTVNMNSQDYEFQIKDNEVFYFLMIQEKEGEVYVETNQ